ncbi:Armadillo repeat-containing protein [Schistosoma japonicum]|nr:Armadillo repeat-containing protein [Schistosoma japonicum]
MTSSIDSDVAQNLSTFDQPTDRDNSSGVSSLWQEVVARLETSVERYICSDDPLLVIKSIRILRQFVVASVMNKLVVGNSPVLRPRLLNSLSRLNQWSTTHINVCIDLFGLVNSLVRDCSSLSEDILSHSELLTDFMNLILNEKTDPMVREADLLFLRSLFRAGDLSSVVAQSPREKIAVELFTETTLQILINSLLLSVPDTVSELSNNSNFTLRTSHQSILVLTPNARCSLIEILSLLSTSSELAERLHLCGALDLCHQTIMLISCRHRLRSGDQPKLNPMNRGKTLCNRIGCNRTISPSNQLAARFSLKLMLHLFFHLPNALDSFQKIYNEEEPIKLIACYSHLTGTMPPVSPNVCYSTPRYQRTKRVLSGTMSSANSTTITFTNNSTSVDTSTVTVTSPNEFYPDNKSRQFHQNSIDSATSIDKHSGSPCPVDSHITVSTCSCAPLDHGTFALTGLLRGLIYWRLANQYANAQTVEAVDQFGTHVITSAGLGITGDDIALLIIQPLTESCLHLEATRILTWACHVLVLVLDKSPELHMWTVYTNSFVREVDYRVTSLLKAVQEASDSQSHTQFLEHLIPLIKLFSCLASGHEATRILIGELTMCKKLIDFAMRLKSLGSENENIVLQFQHSVVVLLHVLSRSFSLHHTLFRNQTIGRYLLKLIDDNLPNTMQGSYLSAKLVEAASSCLINQALPMCPLKEALIDDFINVFIRLLTIGNIQSLSSSSLISKAELNTQPMITSDNRSNNNSSNSNNSPRSSVTKCTLHDSPTTNLSQHQHPHFHDIIPVLHLNGIWGLSNLLHTTDSSVCINLFHELVSKGVWLELLQLASSIPNNEFNFSFPIKNEWEDNVAKITNFDDMNSGNRASTVPGIMVSQEDAEIKHIDELNQNNEKANDDSRQKYEANLNLFNCFNTHHQHHYRPHHSNNTNNEHQSLFLFNNKVQPKFKLSKNVAQIHVLIVYQTLSFLRNLLRDEHFIDTVVSKHWWNIAQFIVAVLESNYPQPVKEQAVLVVAHIATGRTARCEVHRNGDLVEKLTLFMRSQNSYTKAAALTATYYLLGLQTECLDSCGLLSAFKVKHKPYILSHSRRLRVQHHRHETHHGKKQDLVNPTTSLVSCSMTRREASTCMAQNALEEEAEEEEANEDQDVVVEHGSDFLSGTISEQTSTITQMTDTAISFNIDDNHGNADQSRLRTLRRRRYYRSWQPTSPSISDNHELSEINEQERQLNEPPTESTQSPSSHSRSSSSSSSSTSSTSSCVGETSVTTELTNLHHSVLVDMCGISSPSCTDEDVDVNQHPVTLSSLSPTLTISDRAPLADIEHDEDCGTTAEMQHSTMTDSDLLSPLSSSSQKCEIGLNPDDVSSTEYLNNSEQIGNTMEMMFSTNSNQSESIPSTSQNPPPHPTSSSPLSNSRRDWETGFCYILLPFLQELDSDQILRSTWDWLMLCANKDGKPVFLSSLFHAWQRLYTNIPNLSTIQTTQSEIAQSSSTITNNNNNSNNNIAVSEFLSKIKESIETGTLPNSLLTNLPRYWESRHRHRCRRQHRHHCHRHRHRIHRRQNHQQHSTPSTTPTTTTDQPETISTIDANIANSPVPPSSTSNDENLEQTS